MTFTHALSTNNYGESKFIVSASAANGTHTTIAAALAVASSGDTIFVRDGTYTENLTMVPGVCLSAFSEAPSLSSVTIIGKLTFTTAGSYCISNINFQTNSDFIVSNTGSANCQIGFTNCFLKGTNNTLIQLTNSNASSSLSFSECPMDLATTGITYFTHSGSGALTFAYCLTSNSGGSTTATTHSGGSFTLNYSALLAPYANSGSTATFNASYSIFNTDNQNVTAATIGSTATHFPATECAFRSGSASALSISASATLVLLGGTVNSSNTNAITGAGTIKYAGIAFQQTSTVNTTTKTQLGFLPKVSPTTQVLTSGTAATYTTPANCQWIKIRMIGGGGGGAGTGTGGTAGNGGAGTASTWSGGSLSAGGGGGGTTTVGGAGGTSSNGDVNLVGAAGGPRWAIAQSMGGYGGSGAYGGAGAGGEANGGAGANGQNNTGGGGGGGGSTATTVTAGAGGGSGGYLEKIINSPAATYTYTVGASGSAGTAGTSGVAGGAGGSGIIIIEEYYL